MEDGMAHSPTKEIPHPSSKPHNPKEQDPNFIKVRCHLGAFVKAAVNTKPEQDDI
jgi:hypothetical protein